MKKTLLFLFLFSLIGTTAIGGVSTIKENKSVMAINEGETSMKNGESRKEFDSYINNLENFPCSFMCGNVGYRGFKQKYFTVIEHKINYLSPKEQHIIRMTMKNGLVITLDTSYYEGYDAFDWTIWIKNSASENSPIIKNFNAADYLLKGNNAFIRGILGDHEKQYAEYDLDLTKKDFIDENVIGRSTHVTFPYYDLANDDGGAMIAIGWPGTYRAKFLYDKDSQTTNFVGQGCLDFASYLKPGEQIMSPLIGIVRYYEQNEYTAINAWRRWYVDCNAPTNSDGSKFTSIQGVFLKRDIKEGATNDADSETYETWRDSYNQVINHNMDFDFRLIDAGWYVSPNGESTTTDWWGHVGTWAVDRKKWPANTFKDTINFSLERGKFTQLWFETERVTHLDDLVRNYGFDRRWAIAEHGNNELNFVNLALEDAYQWIKNRVVNMIIDNKIGLYREDFNGEPAASWAVYDAFTGPNRKGMTENLYTQNHFRLWQEVINAQLSVGGCNYIDDCASGGGRNDLLSLRYSFPFNRSDADWAMVHPHSMPLRLAFSHATFRWLPLAGVYVNEMSDGKVGMYNMRASYAPIMTYALQFSKNKNLDWDVVKRGQAEWAMINQYLYKDYYPLTPYHNVSDDKTWDVFQFMDPTSGEGIIQAFRKEKNKDRTQTVCVQGIDDDAYYSLTDTDGNNTLARVRGKALKRGYSIILDNPASAAVILIKKLS